jgi:DNA-directed RNA polymerase subunit RPC12/RpoP
MKAHEYSFCPECGHKLEGDEFLCPSCGFKLAEQPPVAAPPVVEPTPPPVVPVPPVAETVTAPQAQPISYQPTQQQQFVQSKKKSKAWLVILLVVLGVIVIGGGIGAFLIYNGTIPRDKVEFIPEQILEKIAPKPTPVVNAPSKAFYVTYSFTLIDNKKVAIVSSVMEPSFPEKSNIEGAESAFLEFARINYSKDYFNFTSNMKTKKFDNKEEALNERENIKNDFKKKGYELRLMEVQYSVK